MSASKNKLIDKANEEAKKPVNKARVKKSEPTLTKAQLDLLILQKAEALREAAPDEVKPLLPPLSQSKIDAIGKAYRAKTEEPETVANIATIEPAVPETTPPAVEIETPAEHEILPADKPNLLTRLKKSDKVWWVGSALLLIAAIGFYLINQGKHKKEEKKTEQVETNITDQKGQLDQTDENYTKMLHRRIDSNYEVKSSEYEQAKVVYETFHAGLDSKNQELKRHNDELQSKIATADTIDLRNYGRKDAEDAGRH